MPGIFSFACEETDSAYFGAAAHPDQALEATRSLLAQGSYFNASLQEEWQAYGEGAFEMGVPEETDSTDPLDLQEIVEDWKEIFAEVEFLGLVDDQGQPLEGGERYGL